MDQETFKRIQVLFEAALKHGPSDREVFLDAACADRPELKDAVSRLLRADANAGDFIEAAVRDGMDSFERHTGVLLKDPPDLPRQVGRYPILSELGRGGMGRVFIALDPALGRQVALKMLPSEFLRHPEWLARFQREAQILASLNHPNVAVLHSLEHDETAPFLTMELVTGETLAQRLAKAAPGSGLGLAESLRIAIQIADALEFAHARRVVHRDLKPANVAVTPEGGIKVLDFGVAKVIAAEKSAAEAAEVPELDERRSEPDTAVGIEVGEKGAGRRLPEIDREEEEYASGPDLETVPGIILGSPGYMSPEQIEKMPVGPASDIWSLGCILFECLSGRTPFTGRTPGERMAASLREAPNWGALGPDTPARLKQLLAECLTKDPAARLASSSRLKAELEQLASEEAAKSVSGASERDSPMVRIFGRSVAARLARVLLASIFVALVAWVVQNARLGPGSTSPERRIHRLTHSGQVYAFDLSPDDRSVAYTTVSGALVLLDLQSRREETVVGDRTVVEPHWSPDGTEILFCAPDSTGLFRPYIFSLSDRAARGVGSLSCQTATWTSDGSSILATTPSESDPPWRYALIHRRSGDTTFFPGDPAITVTKSISCSPRSEAVMVGGGVTDRQTLTWITPRVGLPAQPLLPDVHILGGQWARDGTGIFYLHQEGEVPEMSYVGIDLATGHTRGSPKRLGPLAGAVSIRIFHKSNQVLYRTGDNLSTLWLLDRRDGRMWTRKSLLSGTFDLYQPRLSPDQTQVAFARNQVGRGSIAVLDLKDGSSRSLGEFGSDVFWPAWAPDGGQIAFQAGLARDARVWIVDAAAGDPRPCSRRTCTGYVYWYPGGRLRYETATGMSRFHTFLDPVSGSETPILSGDSRGSLFQGSISASGRWMAVAGERNERPGVRVWLIDLSDGSERLLSETTAAPIAWSSDEAWVYLARSGKEQGAFGEEQAQILRVRRADGALEVVVDLPPGRLNFWSDADISADGNRIVASLSQPARDLWLAESIASEKP